MALATEKGYLKIGDKMEMFANFENVFIFNRNSKKMEINVNLTGFRLALDASKDKTFFFIEKRFFISRQLIVCQLFYVKI